MSEFHERFQSILDRHPIASSFVSGESLPAAGVIDIADPATGAAWAGASDHGPDVAAAAVESAARAFAAPGWRDIGGDARGAALNRLAALVEAHAEELALYETLASGKPVAATLPEMGAVAVWLRYYAGLAANHEGAVRPVSATAEAVIRREPLGVVAAITPFNAALSLGVWKLAPALAAGNTVVVKPPLEAPFSTLRLAELALEAGIPPGVVNVLTGGIGAATALVQAPAVAGVSITGSSGAARAVGAAASGRLKRFAAEAGGKSAHILFADADLDNAVIAATQGVFSAAGQTCVAGARIFVHDSLRDAFLDRYLARIRRLRQGDPLARDTHVGPLAGPRHEARVTGFVQRALAEGARALIGGARPDLPARLQGGSWFAPTVLDGVRDDMEICREEVFGPVVAVATFRDEDEVIARANGVDYGLAAGFWTRDAGRIRRVAQALQAGTVWVNTYRAIHWRVPFGGYKQSGIGRENGPEGLEEFTQPKAVIAEYGAARDPFA